jgi:hypothetical protein
VVRFAPYGFRATWHHLLVSAGVPRRLEDDPASVVRALDELEAARRLWTQCVDAYAVRRSREKATGRRSPRRTERWYAGAGRLAYCPDPTSHPSEHLAVVVRRVIDAYGTGADWSATCPACGHGRSATEACPHCGVDPRGPTARLPDDVRSRIAFQWREIWKRTAYVGGR